MKKIFRSEASLFDESVRTQVLERFLVEFVNGRPMAPTFEDLLKICEKDAECALLDAVVGLLDDRLLLEGDDRRLMLVQPNEAMVQIGFFTEDTLDLVPEGVQVLCLSDETLKAMDEMGVEAVAAELTEKVAADLAKDLN